MGCDIHAVVQRRTGDTWETVTPPETMLGQYEKLPFEIRNYTLFGILAGVRSNEFPVIAEPRGIPADAGATYGTGDPEIAVSYLADDDKKWLGEHSHSWLTTAEIAAYDWSQASQWTDRKTVADEVGLDRWLPWLLSLADDPADVRLVFGFDS